MTTVQVRFAKRTCVPGCGTLPLTPDPAPGSPPSRSLARAGARRGGQTTCRATARGGSPGRPGPGRRVHAPPRPAAAAAGSPRPRARPVRRPCSGGAGTRPASVDWPPELDPEAAGPGTAKPTAAAAAPITAAREARRGERSPRPAQSASRSLPSASRAIRCGACRTQPPSHSRQVSSTGLHSHHARVMVQQHHLGPHHPGRVMHQSPVGRRPPPSRRHPLAMPHRETAHRGALLPADTTCGLRPRHPPLGPPWSMNRAISPSPIPTGNSAAASASSGIPSNVPAWRPGARIFAWDRFAACGPANSVFHRPR